MVRNLPTGAVREFTAGAVRFICHVRGDMVVADIFPSAPAAPVPVGRRDNRHENGLRNGSGR
jgi:hypothetical protein